MLSEPLCMSTKLKRKESKMLKSREELKTLVHIKAFLNTIFYTTISVYLKGQSPNRLVHQVIP